LASFARVSACFPKADGECSSNSGSKSFFCPFFATRILPVTQAIANRWGVLSAECQARGTPLNTADGMIAATALSHNLTLVTRNTRDFAQLGVDLLDPWDAL
jgi:predicted nucleic acid-binding protein